MSKTNTDILLATYNGADYLPELLESLDKQTDQGWNLVVRDDGSTDNTIAILNTWGKKRPDRLRLINDGQGNLGPSQNFSALLDQSQAHYFLPCDQDDYWLPNKIALLKAKMRRLEEDSADRPLLVHSDLIVTDRTLNTISESFFDYQGLRLPSTETPWKLVTIQNVVTGCAMIGNARLRELARPIPELAGMHDWWLAVIAALKGKLVRENSPLVLYRQHDQNVLGARPRRKPRSVASAIEEFREIKLSINRASTHTVDTAQAILDHFPHDLEVEQLGFFNEMTQFPNMNRAARLRLRFRHQLWYKNFMHNIALLILD